MSVRRRCWWWWLGDKRESLAADCKISRDEAFQKAKLRPDRSTADGPSLWRGESIAFVEIWKKSISVEFSTDKMNAQGKKCPLAVHSAVNESQFRTRDKSGVFVKSWLSTSVEWENETRKVDLKQTWPEGLVSWLRLNLLCFVPNARPIIWNLGFHSCRSLETIYRLILVIDHFYSSQTVFNNSLTIVVCLCLSLMRAVDCSGWVGDPAPTRQVGWIAAVLARWQGGGGWWGGERTEYVHRKTDQIPETWIWLEHSISFGLLMV